jgi:hypothetical protein
MYHIPQLFMGHTNTGHMFAAYFFYALKKHGSERIQYNLCGLVIRLPGYRSRGPGSILGATRFSE